MTNTTQPSPTTSTNTRAWRVNARRTAVVTTKAALLAAVPVATIAGAIAMLRMTDRPSEYLTADMPHVAKLGQMAPGRGYTPQGFDLDEGERVTWSILSTPEGGDAAAARIGPTGVMVMADLDRNRGTFHMIAYAKACKGDMGTAKAARVIAYNGQGMAGPARVPDVPWVRSLARAVCAGRHARTTAHVTARRTMDWMMRSVAGIAARSIPDPTGTPMAPVAREG